MSGDSFWAGGALHTPVDSEAHTSTVGDGGRGPTAADERQTARRRADRLADSELEDAGAADSRPVDAEAVLDALGNEATRTILRHLASPASAQQLAGRCDVPVTTVYRRLRRLAATSLVAERIAIRDDGRHVRTYVRRFSQLRVAVADDGSIEAEVERRREE